MQLEPQFIPPRAPSVFWEGPDENKKAIAYSFQLNLVGMEGSAKQLAAAVALFQISGASATGRDSLYLDWLSMAGRDGALAIRNFAVALQNVRQLLGQIPEWLAVVDSSSLKESEKLFHERFPFAHKMRHSVAHPEFYADPNKKMGITGDFETPGFKATACENISVSGAIFHDTFSATFEGTYVHYKLAPDTILGLNEICEQAFEALAAIDGFR